MKKIASKIKIKMKMKKWYKFKMKLNKKLKKWKLKRNKKVKKEGWNERVKEVQKKEMKLLNTKTLKNLKKQKSN